MSPRTSTLYLGITLVSSSALLGLLFPSYAFCSTSSCDSFFAFTYPIISTLSLDKPTSMTGNQDGASKTSTNDEETRNENNNDNDNDNNNTSALRTYTNTAFNLVMKYPSTWGAMELKTNPSSADKLQGSSLVAIILPHLENKSDNFQDRALISVQNLLRKMTLEDYTNSSLSAYGNQSDSIKILESNSTTLAGQPAHKIVYTDDTVEGIKLKKIQVWSLINNTNAYVITFGSEESRFADYLPEVDNIIRSFRIIDDSSNAGNNNIQSLTFDDPKFGIKLQYPPTWTKFQPGLPLDNRSFAFIVTFTAPRAPVSVSQNNSSANPSPATINIGINDIGNRNITLADYSTIQLDHIRQIDAASIISSNQTTVGGLPAQELSYLIGNGSRITQLWTLNEGKAYHFILSATNHDNFEANRPVFDKMVKSIEFN